MRIYVVAITFAVTIGGLFLFENYKTPPQEQNYAKILGNLQQSGTPAPQSSIQPTKTPVKTSQPTKRPAVTSTAKPSFSPTPSPLPTSNLPSPTSHLFYTSSSTSAKYYYCDTDSGWKNLSKANLKQFSSPEDLLKSYPSRIIHEPCKS